MSTDSVNSSCINLNNQEILQNLLSLLSLFCCLGAFSGKLISLWIQYNFSQCGLRENVSVEPSTTDNKQEKRSKNENSHVMDLSLLNEDANLDKMINLPSIWWVAIFDAARETMTKSSKESLLSDALLIMILVVMRSDVNSDREK